MVLSITYPIRFVIDEFFIRDILKDKPQAAKIILKLDCIHKSSKDYPLTHNRMFDESFKNSISDKQIRGAALLGAFSPEPSPNFVQNEPDFESRLIKYAINLATKKPYNIIILTSEEQSKKYIQSKAYENAEVKSSVVIFYGDSASRIIDIMANYTN